jgi:hypothetical protein
MKAGPAYEALAFALDGLDAHTPCHGRPEWISDDSTDQAYAAAHCTRCPLLDLCTAAAAELKPTAGVWAGVTYPRSKRKAAA